MSAFLYQEVLFYKWADENFPGLSGIGILNQYVYTGLFPPAFLDTIGQVEPLQSDKCKRFYKCSDCNWQGGRTDEPVRCPKCKCLKIDKVTLEIK